MEQTGPKLTSGGHPKGSREARQRAIRTYRAKTRARVQAYKLEHGWEAITKGNEIDHLCMTRRCVRPKHLESVTKEVNLDRRDDW